MSALGMMPKIKSVEPQDDMTLKVQFVDGRTVLYDVGRDAAEIPDFAPLAADRSLFRQARLDSSGTCVFWNEFLDLPSDAIWEFGKEIKEYATLPHE